MDRSRPSLRLPTDAGGELLDQALAKRRDEGRVEQTYRQHLIAVYDAWCALVQRHTALIDCLAKRYGCSAKRLLQSSLLTVALHDVGKLTENFQRMMRAKDGKELGEARKANYRHEVAGLWLVTYTAGELCRRHGPIPGQGRLEALAVAGHHKFLADRFLFDETRFTNPITWFGGANPNPAVTAAMSLAQAMFHDQGWELPQLTRQPGLLEFMLRNDQAFHHLLALKKYVAVEAQSNRSTAVAFHELFTLLKGLLMAADWTASEAHGEEAFRDAFNSVVSVGLAPLPEHLRGRLEQRRRKNPDLPAFAGFTPFQSRCSQSAGHVLAVAPTGSGKTEAALAWALHQVDLGHARKIMFLLPTMVTANSIHDRLEAFFGRHGHKVGLVHSTADLVRERGMEEGAEADRPDVRSEVLHESHFFSPVTVGTVDQVLVPLFHAGRWALKTFGAASSAIILDEIHAYEPHTLGLIVTMIEQLRSLGARIFVMSATMPTSLRRVILDALGTHRAGEVPVEEIEEEALLDDARSEWAVRETTLLDWLLTGQGTDDPGPSPQFRELWNERNERGRLRRILIVVNSVHQCQALAKALSNFNPVCYHSKFIFMDRERKERIIDKKRPRLLIATQVVEVSLDIDYDFLLTECAPFDALVQRAGRVNRGRRPHPGRVVVHRHDQKSERVYSRPVGILDRTWSLLLRNQGLLSERQLIAMVEEAYEGLDPGSHGDFRNARSQVRDHQYRLAGVLDAPKPQEESALLKTRLDDYPQISVIPFSFAEVVADLPPRERRRYELKMPVWYTRHNMVESDGLPFCKMNYDPDYGGFFPSVPGYEEPGTALI